MDDIDQNLLWQSEYLKAHLINNYSILFQMFRQTKSKYFALLSGMLHLLGNQGFSLTILNDLPFKANKNFKCLNCKFLLSVMGVVHWERLDIWMTVGEY